MTLIEKHKKLIQILEAIQDFKRRRIMVNDWITGFPGTFPDLKRKYEHRLIIIDASIDRLKSLYTKKLKEL